MLPDQILRSAREVVELRGGDVDPQTLIERGEDVAEMNRPGARLLATAGACFDPAPGEQELIQVRLPLAFVRIVARQPVAPPAAPIFPAEVEGIREPRRGEQLEGLLLIHIDPVRGTAPIELPAITIET